MAEKKNSKNAYVCDKLHSIVTIHRDGGTTPMFIPCPECKGRATSRMGMIDCSMVPTHEWYKPNDEEIEAEALRASKKYKIDFNDVFISIDEHAKRGGLLLRAINQTPQEISGRPPADDEHQETKMYSRNECNYLNCPQPEICRTENKCQYKITDKEHEGE